MTSPLSKDIWDGEHSSLDSDSLQDAQSPGLNVPYHTNHEWWHTPDILALGEQKQKGQKSKFILDHTASQGLSILKKYIKNEC